MRLTVDLVNLALDARMRGYDDTAQLYLLFAIVASVDQDVNVESAVQYAMRAIDAARVEKSE